MTFEDNTRRKVVPLDPFVSAAAGGTRPKWALEHAGILAGIRLDIKGTLAGTLSALNALGYASILKWLNFDLSTRVDLAGFSGAGYHYIIRDFLSDYKDPVPSSNARSAVAAGNYDISINLPVTLNQRDRVGLINLQNDLVQVNLRLEIESDAIVATGITSHSIVVQPYLVFFTMPPDPKDRPLFNTVHSWMEDQQTVAAAGDVAYPWPVGNTILGMFHGLGIGVSGADLWTKAKMRAQQNDVVEEYLPGGQDLAFEESHGRARPKGAIGMDFLGSSGLGAYGSARDSLVTLNMTSAKSIITATAGAATKTLYSIRRELVVVEAPEGKAA
jgi:hypothetical protein